jgi:hypothetical protein
MNRAAFVFLAVISILLPTQSLKPRLSFKNSVLKGNASPNRKLQSTPQMFRGGTMFDNGEEEENMFDHLETLNEFASLQQDIYSPPSNSKMLLKQNQRSK